MKGFRFQTKITAIALGKLCRQRGLLTGLALLCLILPLCIVPAAEYALSQGISFSGITLAITGVEGDPVPEQLEKVLRNMKDINRYCRIDAMEYEESLQGLREGTVTAALVIPENFVQGVMDGSNPDVRLIVPGDHPIESLLTLWIGQSTSDLLAAVQSGIAVVLESYYAAPPTGLSPQTVITQINLRYINWTVNRQSLFDEQRITATGQLPIGLHYGLSLVLYLVQAAAPFFTPLYEKNRLVSERRFRTVGWGSGAFYCASLTACWLLIFPLLTVTQCILVKGHLALTLVSGALCSLFCAALCTVCCLLTTDAGRCGVLSFLLSMALLFLAGGILPPVLMPQRLSRWVDVSPISWMRGLLAAPADAYELPIGSTVALTIFAAVLIVAGAVLYERRGSRKGDGA